MDCPAKLTNQYLMRQPKSRIERLLIRREHHAAKIMFEDARRVTVQSLEETMPGLSKARALIQNAIPTESSFGNMPSYELILISTVCAHRQPKSVFEFGTYDGLTTLHLAINSTPNSRVYTIDLAPDDPIRQQNTDDTFYTQGVKLGAHFLDAPEANQVEQIYADTTKYDYSRFKGQMDFIFVDAGHTYDLVRSDSEKALEMIKPGGIIFWHDYYFTQHGVYTWLNELAGKIPLRNAPGTSLVYYVNH